MLSILIPTYNHTCFHLADVLHTQAEALSIDYEIIVAEDGSRDQVSKVANLKVSELSHCRYIRREENVGRARIRNFLASQAKHEWLLFIDSDMIVRSEDYLLRYAQIIANAEADCYYGGYRVGEEALRKNPYLTNNLRYIYETTYQGNDNATERNKSPFDNIHTCNLLIRKQVLNRCPFDERFLHYGYEDVLLGIELGKQGYRITHIDNPLSFEIFESNKAFLAKSEEALRTLHTFRKELSLHSPIITFSNRLKSLAPLLRLLFMIVKSPMATHLQGKHPSLLVFKAYKVLYYLSIR